ncbi:MAG: TrmH family RNA methyltransferase [Myxococcaceae bacterium]
MKRLRGGGPRYENAEPPSPDEFVVDARKERVERVVSLRTRNLCVVLDRLEDSFNIAAVLRTCEGLGIQEIHVIQNPEYPFEAHQKVTQGCEKWLEIRKYKRFADCKAALKARGFELWASAIREGATKLYEMRFDRKIAFVLGNERYGVSQEVLDGVDGVYWIPMRGFSQSFNISVAAAMTLSHAVMWRIQHGGEAGDLAPDEAKALRDHFVKLSVKQGKRIYKDLHPMNPAAPRTSEGSEE